MTKYVYMYVCMYVLTSSACTGLAMSFEWMRILRRDGYLMLGFAKVDEEKVVLFVLEALNRESLIIAWCDQL